MRKFVILFFVIACAFTLIGCEDEIIMEEPVHLSSGVEWGVTLTAQDVTSTGLTLVCTQTDGAPTGQLQTSRFYCIQMLNQGKWIDVPYKQEMEICWTMEAWNIVRDDIEYWTVDWEGLYGSLPKGRYRIGKDIMDLRQPGDYDINMHYAYFEIL